MTTLLDFTKKVEIVLTKRGLDNPPPTRVCLAIDISGSMQGLYSNRTVQRTVDRLLGLAAKFDDDGSLDVFTFDNGVDEFEPATAASFNGYVDTTILRGSGHKWGGTSYSPVIEKIIKKYFPKSWFGGGVKKGLPGVVIFITDGENDDRPNAMWQLDNAKGVDIYWQFVGIGGAGFSFIREAADKLPNVGFMVVRDIERTTDEELYEGLLNPEMVEWIKGRSAAQQVA